MRFDSLAIDSSAAVDFFNPKRPIPPGFQDASELVLPLPVLGELKFGVLNSPPTSSLLRAAALDRLRKRCRLLLPDVSTADYYAETRRQIAFPPNMSRRRESHLLNDLWIAALCVQHKLPLLSNDRDFDGIEGLEVIHW
jgi:tRNA(fMet)-specific endonuclease VapC